MKPILEASIQDCHVIGLDSIVLKARAPMVRIYFARENHVLWHNDPRRDDVMSLGLHQHRTDITITPLFGNVYNVLTGSLSMGFRKTHREYVYHSQIKEGKGGFEKLQKGCGLWVYLESLAYPRYMHGTLLHSVYIPKRERAAWLITEGKPNTEYSPNLLTNDENLETADFSHLYRPMTQERMDEDVEMISKLCEVKL
jgi:hypothetical protein